MTVGNHMPNQEAAQVLLLYWMGVFAGLSPSMSVAVDLLSEFLSGPVRDWSEKDQIQMGQTTLYINV